MARGNQYAWGSGIASGANSFIQTYMQLSRQEHEDKLNKNNKLIEIIMDRLHDDDVPLRDRARMLNEIPGLLDIKKNKMGRPLADRLGLTKEFLDKAQTPEHTETKLNPGGGEIIPGQDMPAQYITERGLQATSTTPATPDKTIRPDSWTGSTDFVSSTVNPAFTKNVIPESQEKMGDLTPALIKRKRAREDAEYEIQQKKELFDYQTQQAFESAKYRGFNQILGRTTDPVTGQSIITLGNDAGNKIEIPLRGESEIITRERLRQKGAGRSGKLKELTQAEDIIADYKSGDPNVTIGDYISATKILEEFERTGEYKKAITEVARQTAGGTKKIQPSQKADDQARMAETLSKLETDENNAQAEESKAQALAASAKDAVNRYYNENIKQHDDAINAYFREIGMNPQAPDQKLLAKDNKFQVMNRAKQALIPGLEKLKEVQRNADANLTAIQGKKENVNKVRRNYLQRNGIDPDTFEQDQAARKGPTPEQMTKIAQSIPAVEIQKIAKIPGVAALIAAARKEFPDSNNPNHPTYTTDEQIVRSLIANGQITRKGK